MPKSSLLLLCLLLFAGRAVAQQADDYYYPYATLPEQASEMLLPDSALFYRAILSAEDLVGKYAGYSLSFVARKRRGLSWNAETASVEGLDLPYRYFTPLRALGAVERSMAGMATTPAQLSGMGGVREFSLLERTLQPSHQASVHFTDRNYLAGTKLSVAENLGHGWTGAAALDARTGRDMYIDGVFTHALTVSLRASKRYAAGHSLDLVLVVPPSARGLRSAAAEEAFRLTGDRLYNPAWGYHDGKVRNSHVRREFVPLLLAAGRFSLWPSTTLATALSVEYGHRKYSSLGWYDARTPLPDNYRWMPSYSGDAAAEQAWRRGDEHITQIDWDELIRQNRLAGGHAIYALEDRIDRVCDVRLNAIFTTVIDDRLRLHYGVAWSRSDTRSYKQMRDLLGAQYLTDIDQYLIDDDTYNNLLQNDLRHPDRTIREGGRFGYDYALIACDLRAQLMAEYRSDRFRADVGLALHSSSVMRRGFYEKELFPGDRSYGSSRRMRFTPYTIKVQAGWAFSPRSYLGAAAMAAARMPDAADLFFQPQYNNRTVDDPAAVENYAAELCYRLATPKVNISLTAFVAASLGDLQTRRYFDDMAGVFCNVAVMGIGTLSYGLEAAAEVRLAYRWSLALSASAGHYKYNRNPRVTLLSDVDNTVVDNRAQSYMGGCRVGGAPQLTACAELSYFGPKGWGLRASGAYAGSRYVEPMAVRRTERIARQGGSTRELFDAFTRQERLDDVFRLDASVFKTFLFDRSRLTAGLMLRNLLGDRDAVYGGYESLRVFRRKVDGANLYEPQPTRYTYAYPRSFYLTISYKF